MLSWLSVTTGLKVVLLLAGFLQVAKICQEAGSSMSSDDLAKKLCEAAAKSGSSDDITVIAVRLENLL